MRVLLIDPPYQRLAGFKSEWFPLGVASIAACLEKNDPRDSGVKNQDQKVVKLRKRSQTGGRA